MSVAERFGQNLARHRKRAGLSQDDISFRASLHRTAIGFFERGERLPRVDTLVKLAGALDVSPCDLLEGLAWTPPQTESGRFLDG